MVPIASVWAPTISASMAEVSRKRMGWSLVEPRVRSADGLLPSGETRDMRDETLFQVMDMNARLRSMQSWARDFDHLRVAEA